MTDINTLNDAYDGTLTAQFLSPGGYMDGDSREVFRIQTPDFKGALLAMICKAQQLSNLVDVDDYLNDDDELDGDKLKALVETTSLDDLAAAMHATTDAEVYEIEFITTAGQRLEIDVAGDDDYDPEDIELDDVIEEYEY